MEAGRQGGREAGRQGGREAGRERGKLATTADDLSSCHLLLGDLVDLKLLFHSDIYRCQL